MIELEARYAFETDDGTVVYVENKGLRFGPVDLLQKLKRGEPVDPKLIYFRTVPEFETGSEKYRWLMEHLFIASAARHADRVLTACRAYAGEYPSDWEYPGREHVVYASERDAHESLLCAWGVPRLPPAIRAGASGDPRGREPLVELRYLASVNA